METDNGVPTSTTKAFPFAGVGASQPSASSGAREDRDDAVAPATANVAKRATIATIDATRFFTTPP
jgi:hypothetical protein